MKKTTPSKSSKKNGNGQGPLPDVMTPALVQAVLVDAVMEAAAEQAAMTLMPPPSPGLVGIPLLGATRILALADAGILTLDDLRAAPVEQIASAKGVGVGNAERIKAWLTAQEVVSPGMPPAPPEIDVLPFEGYDVGLASDNQTIFDTLGEIDALIVRLRERGGEKGLSKSLSRQCDKASATAAELAEGPDTLTAKQLQQSLKLVSRIVTALKCALEAKKLSEKKQDALSDEIREHRRALQKVLGD